ncbi:hypothetical protein LTR91_024451 [Friedmanniomyces endolithicus]|uniref:Uncharacterized protein n=1 Tax=Friedmanniomyces endolithicus TaxID=329885 RepID=A0AAN6H6Z1_9PEZI|nr:hypothetical protein LTR91_024451 [Friedmanniomyces endolithicus]
MSQGGSQRRQSLSKRLLNEHGSTFSAWIQFFDLSSPWDGRPDIHRRIAELPSPLYAASHDGVEDAVCTILNDIRTNVNIRWADKGSALYAASDGGHEKVVEMLLAKGVYVNAQGGYYGNALKVASAGGHEKVVEMLLARGADVNAQGGWHGNALQAASAGGHEKVVEMLMDAGTPQSPCGLSRTSKTNLLNTSRGSSIDQQDRKRTGVPTTSNDRTPVSAKATSQRTYIKAICEVLDQHPSGLEKEQVLEEVGRHRAEWFPDRSFENVSAGLHSTFSVQAKSKDPKIWERRSIQEENLVKGKVYPQTTARPASAYRHQQSDSPTAGSRLSTTPHNISQSRALADARTESLPTSDKSGTSRRNDIVDGNYSMRARNDDKEQAPLHLWRAAAQDSRLNQSTITLDESANLSQPADVSTVGHHDEQVVKDPESGASEPVTPHVDTPSHAPSTSPQTGPHERRASPPDDSESALWPQGLGEAGSDTQLIHWGKQVR